nr:hypothetical protein [Nanoarchaeum sp.]
MRIIETRIQNKNKNWRCQGNKFKLLVKKNIHKSKIEIIIKNILVVFKNLKYFELINKKIPKIKERIYEVLIKIMDSVKILNISKIIKSSGRIIKDFILYSLPMAIKPSK